MVEGLDRFLGPVFLHKPHRDDNGHRYGNTDGVIHISQEERGPGRHEKQHDQGLLELLDESKPYWFRGVMGYLVRAMFAESFQSFVGMEPLDQGRPETGRCLAGCHV
jgi:hypothetical protein